MNLFGSSGIRGHFNDLITPEFMCRVGLAAGHLYGDVVVGRDARTTSPLLAHALISGLLSAGADAHSAGLVSTPTLAHATRGFEAGVMITASHNPATDNGVKMWNPDGSSFGSGQMAALEEAMSAGSPGPVPWDRVGSLRNIDWAVDSHIRAISKDIGPLNAKVVVDCGNGATSNITPYLLRRLGCEVVTLNGHPDGSFPGRESEPGRENMKLLASCVRESGADIGIAHDGDGDRMVAVDEKGNFADGDALLPLFCKAEGRSKVVVPVDASMAVDRYLGGVEVLRCKVGDVFVSEKIKETGADFGGEPSGTWVFPQMSFCPDGIYAAARLVKMIESRPLSEQLAGIPRFTVLRTRVDLPVSRRKQAMAAISAAVGRLGPAEVSELDGIRATFADGWMLIRPSGTEPKLKVVVEGETLNKAERLQALAMKAVKEATG